MSSFIPNSFQLPNALIDDGVMAEMKGAALAIYILIVRKTRGWQKETDAISISQFMKFTGYGKDAVISGAEKLVSLGLVSRISRERQPTLYTLSDLAEREIASLSEKPNTNNQDLSENTTGVVGKTDKSLSEKPTHNNNSKTTITKANIYKGKFNFANALVSQGADQKLISEYMEVRKAKKAVNSETAFKSLISEQQKSGLTLNQVLEHCVVNSWKGFKAEWIKNQSTVHGQQNKPSRWDEIQELIAKEEAGNEQYGF
ncbi:replication protein [Acinetobacter baumannii]|uniref:replication protein n=1 Tax=Acinetobacter calcoaceticus/baumannii complex TaxID=909768 RepID=UPI00165F6B57|nr:MULTISPECIES: replication protein [Acinetobacter calcoaceticus/baumannii complex]MBD0068486.1 replication protein [Acinetobacter baumannii]MBD0104976.1 replication protein [Acinetobacter baumannii]